MLNRIILWFRRRRLEKRRRAMIRTLERQVQSGYKKIGLTRTFIDTKDKDAFSRHIEGLIKASRQHPENS